MASEAERNEYFDEELDALAHTPGKDNLDAALEARMLQDDRLESGVPGDLRHDDIGFIQFSGITRPDLADEPPAPVEHEGDLDPSVPVSFYEPGVADVDSAMAPAGSEDGPRESDVILPLRPPPVVEAPQTPNEDDPPSAAALKDMIAELSGGELTLEDLEITGNDDPDREHGDPADEAISREESEPEPEPERAQEPEPEHPSEPETGAVSLDALDIFASALAQPPIPSPTRPEPVDVPAPAASRDAVAAPPTPVLRDEQDNTLKARMAPRLNEAEQLMAALDVAPQNAKPADDAPCEEEPAEEIWAPAPVSPSVLADENFEPAGETPPPAAVAPEAYVPPPRQRDDPACPNRRSSRGGRKRRRAIRALAILTTLALGIASVCALLYIFVLPRLGPPGDAYARAMENWNAQNYLAASTDFTLFAQRNPEHPNRAEAQFRAALAKQTAALTRNRDERDRLNREALAMFESYIADNPLHRKVARAESLCGVLLYDLGDYKGAITRLRNARRSVSDPDAALASLRTLAAAYSKLGQVDDAESTYLQAAVLPGNYTRDVDYLALGDLFSRHAEMATDPGSRGAYQQKASEYWTLTLSLAAADPKAKKEVQAKLNMINAIRQQDEADTNELTPPVDAVDSPNEATVVEIIEGGDASAQDAPSADAAMPGSPEPDTAVAIETPAAEPDPAEEAAFLEGDS